MLLGEVIYLHLGIGLLVATAVFHRFFLSFELEFLPDVGGEYSSNREMGTSA